MGRPDRSAKARTMVSIPVLYSSLSEKGEAAELDPLGAADDPDAEADAEREAEGGTCTGASVELLELLGSGADDGLEQDTTSGISGAADTNAQSQISRALRKLQYGIRDLCLENESGRAVFVFG